MTIKIDISISTKVQLLGTYQKRLN